MTARRSPDDHTASVEDYLKAIYEVEQAADRPAATSEIAERLGVAPASVTGMIRRLARQGLLEHERYRGVRLTAEGRRVALAIIRRHRVIETYLTEKLGYPWDRVHPEAERLEHAASSELVERMAAALGEPTTDPHGAPIPTREGRIERHDAVPIAELPPETPARIVEVSDDDPALLRRLDRLGLGLGSVIAVTGTPRQGRYRLRLGGVRADEGEVRTIGPELASAVLAVPLASGPAA